MQKKTKRIIILTILILIILSISILILNTTKKMPRKLNEQAQAEYTTTIGDKIYDITNAVAENANSPTMSAGMIPVKWDGAYWTLTTKDDINWYNYSGGQPSYIMLNDGTYQSELVQDMTGKKLAKDYIGAQILEEELGSIYMWLPRYAYNESGEILHIKQGYSVAGSWTMPEIFTYTTNEIDFSLAGIWIEYNPLSSTDEVTTKISNMTGEENKYGFISNTKPIAMTQTDLTAIEKYTVGAGLASALKDITNINRTILKITNTNQVEPIKGIAILNADELTINIEVTYRTNAISKIIDSKGRIISENSTTATDTELLGNGTYKYIVIDNVGNMKEIVIKVTGLKIYVIPNLERLKEFRDEVNAGNNFSGITVIQTADIQMNEGKYTIDEITGEITFADDAEEWEPIGTNESGMITFNGIYDGENHTISGIYIDNEEMNDVGLFRVLKGTIQNLNIREAKVIGKSDVGAIVGYASGTIKNCSNSGIITGESYVGGICGYGSGCTITGCYNEGMVASNSSKAGGICGCGFKSITNCYNVGNIIGSDSNAGGICGYVSNSNAEIRNCYNYGNIYGKSYVAGVIGQGFNVNVIENCYNVGNITGTENYIAGINGYTYETKQINNCYNEGNIKGNNCTSGILGTTYQSYSLKINNCYNKGDVVGTEYCGGILARSNSSIGIKSSYNIGTISGTKRIGGIAGYHAYATSGGGSSYDHSAMVKCYNVGEIIGSGYVGGCSGEYNGNGSGVFSQNYNMRLVSGTNYVGGIVGYKARSYSTISSCYYETGTASYGIGESGTSGNNTGCTSTTRENIISYITALDEYKADEYSINDGLPILSWQTDNDKLNLINGDNAFVEDTEGINNGYPILAWQVETEE